MHEIDKTYAQSLRQRSTHAEHSLWFRLRSRRLDGHKFRREHVIGPYIVDFICLEARLVVEADGGQHADQLAYDEARTRYLESCGYRVLRFWDNEILQQIEGVLEVILAALRERMR